MNASMYEYAARDPQSSPGHYMFSSFRGTAMLEGYAHSRRALIEGVRNLATSTVAKTSEDLTHRGSETETLRQLAECVRLIESGNASLSFDMVQFFAKKVDLARHLRASYINGRKATEDDAGIHAYVFLHFCCVYQTDAVWGTAAGLQLLNSALKIGDILAFKGPTNVPFDACSILLKSLLKEMGLVAKLQSEHRVRPSS